MFLPQVHVHVAATEEDTAQVHTNRVLFFVGLIWTLSRITPTSLFLS